MATMTRDEHIQWCKDRAIQEFDYYTTPEEKWRNGVTSMMSDLGKHPETGGSAIQALCMMQLMQRPAGRQQFVSFINGFK